MRTRLTELLDIEHPVMLAGMGGVSYHQLVAAVSAAGGIGTLGASTMGAELADEMAKVRALTSKPFGVDLLTALPGQVEAGIDAVIDGGARIFVAGLGVPREAVDALHDANVLVGSMCGKVRHAVSAVASGCDFVVAQGTEAGGHTGTVATMALVPQVVDAVGDRVPVVAAGGLFDGRGLAAALTLGADGVWVGTRFIATPEARAVDGYKETLIGLPEDGTVVSRSFTGKTCRVVRNDWTQHFEEHPDELQPFPAQAVAAARAGVAHLGDHGGQPVDLRREFMPCGQGVGAIDGLIPAGDLVVQMVAEAERALSPRVCHSRGMTLTGSATGLAAGIDQRWDDDVLPTLTDYIRIPNVSKAFDEAWEANGYMEQAVAMIRDWCAARPIAGLTVDVHRLPGLTPLIVCEVPASDPQLAERTVLLYGHLDKQPEMAGWRDGLGPWTPVIEDDKLYGRGGADDGYAAFAALVAIECAQVAGLPHARLVVLIEASEESGSPDLPAYVDALADRIGAPELVICLDGGCLDDERLWLATSLRGLVNGELTVEVLTAGAHSGQASGVVPSSFRIARQLLDRIEDSATGTILLPELHVEIPADRVAAAQATAEAIDFAPAHEFPFAGGTQPMTQDTAEQFLAQTWHPTVSYIGADGFPPPDRAGNVLRPWTRLTLSFRLPPTCDEHAARAAIEAALTADPPSGAIVRWTTDSSGPGWAAPALAPWLETALDDVSTTAFGQPARSFGEGGTIPFMGMLGARFPAAQFVVTGALVPGSNAHGPDEFLHLPTARRVTECIARLLGAHASSPAP